MSRVQTASTLPTGQTHVSKLTPQESLIFSNLFQTKVSMYRALTDAILTGKRLHGVGSTGASPVHQRVPVQRHEEHLTATA